MTTFQEFLRRKAPAEFDPALRRDRDEWVTALRTLRDTLKGWAKEIDPDGYLFLRDREYPRFDRRLGRYEAPGLEVRLGTTSVEVEPSSRSGVSRPQGRHAGMWVFDPALGSSQGVVLVHGPGLICPLHRFQPAGGAPIWVLENRPTDYRIGSAAAFDREQFALVLQELLT